jgi:hypothetical protein
MAEDKKAREEIAKLGARSLAMRDILAWLLACEATRAEDPDALLQSFSETGDKRVAKLPPDHMPFAEEIRKEFDWMLATAKKMLAKTEE